jgi:selenocysteine lyase/cysteine desulfurase
MTDYSMRDLFCVPENYFLSHSVGCLPLGTQDIVGEYYFKPWKTGENWKDWMSYVMDFRKHLGKYLGVAPSSICPQVNISSALTKIIHSLPVTHSGLAKRRKIILSRDDFPTIGFVFKTAERMGYEIRFIEGHATDIQAWREAIDDTTAIVHITHALSNTSHLLPVKEICDLARQHEAISIVDIAQSFGAVPVPIQDWCCDFVTGTGVKFLCAGTGACFLYASETMLNTCRPLDVGWFSHENPFEMDIGSFRYADDAMRFFGGTPSIAPITTANAAFELWDIIGFDKVHSQIQTHLEALVAPINSEILVSPKNETARGASFVISPSNKEVLRQALKSASIFHDERTDGFRFSVHGYTASNEVATLNTILDDCGLHA